MRIHPHCWCTIDGLDENRVEHPPKCSLIRIGHKILGDERITKAYPYRHLITLFPFNYRMATSNSNTPRFRMMPTFEAEDAPHDPNPYMASPSVLRVVSELKFLASIIAGIYVQRRFGIIDQIETVADVPKLVVLVAGAWTLGENTAHLFYDSVFARKFRDLAPPPQPRRRWRRREGF